MKRRISPSTAPGQVFDTTHAAEFLGLSASSLEMDRCRHHLGVPYIKAGRRVLYRECDLVTFLESCRVVPGVAP
jgi:hypothetical protein